MSLMQLLAVGRSIKSISDQHSPYRMRQENLLPKFGAARTTVCRAADAAPATDTKSATVGITPAREAATEEPRVSKAIAARTALTVLARTMAKTLRVVFPIRQWAMLKKNPFKPKPAAPAVSLPVQGELSLELVKPVRNDLSDADLEIIHASKEDGPARRETTRREELGPHRLLWSRLTARIFRTGSA